MLHLRRENVPSSPAPIRPLQSQHSDLHKHVVVSTRRTRWRQVVVVGIAERVVGRSIGVVTSPSRRSTRIIVGDAATRAMCKHKKPLRPRRNCNVPREASSRSVWIPDIRTESRMMRANQIAPRTASKPRKQKASTGVLWNWQREQYERGLRMRQESCTWEQVTSSHAKVARTATGKGKSDSATRECKQRTFQEQSWGVQGDIEEVQF